MDANKAYSVLDLDAVFDDDRAPAAVHALLISPSLIETPAGYLAPSDLPEEWHEFYEERAAIREFDGHQPREHAEAEALREVVAKMRAQGRDSGEGFLQIWTGRLD